MKTDPLLIACAVLVFGGFLAHCLSAYFSAPAPKPSCSCYQNATLH